MESLYWFSVIGWAVISQWSWFQNSYALQHAKQREVLNPAKAYEILIQEKVLLHSITLSCEILFSFYKHAMIFS